MEIKQLQWGIIQFMPLVTKSQIKSVTNDYPKFYMFQVMLFMKNEPAKNKKQLFWRHEIQQGLGLKPGAPVHSKFFLPNIIFLHFRNFSVIEFSLYICVFFSFLFFVYLFVCFLHCFVLVPRWNNLLKILN